MDNSLAGETSPYLLQHKDNPVHWLPWGQDALDRARTENKPILLSVGYAACHWCHVMAHESFENQAIAERMNASFINVKVDREERPDIDTIYQSALQMMGEQGGWPLTMFLTPEGEPFWGGTYFPPESRWGRPGFPDILNAISKSFSEEPGKIIRNATALRDGLARLSAPTAGAMITGMDQDRFAYGLIPHFDSHHGGFGTAPKFPQPSMLKQIWYAWKRTGDHKILDPLLLTLSKICQGGIYDHLAGGFSRYTVDEAWLVPHFEKMLYDNAQILELLTLAWQQTKNPLFAIRVAESISFLLRDMQEEGGAFASSFDADSEGEEGRYYVWDEAEVDQLLGSDAPLFKQVYGITETGNFEGRNILNRLSQRSENLDRDEEVLLAPSRAKLLYHREKRVAPDKDDKILTDWNGLAIKALAFAGRVFNRPDWIEEAVRAYDFILSDMTVDGRLLHSWRMGQARHAALLDDYANMIAAAQSLHSVAPDPRYLQQAEIWFAILEQHYRAPDGAYYLTADDASGLITRTKNAMDQAVPSGNGVMVECLARLYCLTGKTVYRDRAEEIITCFSGELEQRAFSYSNLITGAHFLENPVQIILVGPMDDSDLEDMKAAVFRASLPLYSLDIIEGADKLPSGHPAWGKETIVGKATAYVCVGPVCSTPVTSAGDLEIHLHSLK